MNVIFKKTKLSIVIPVLRSYAVVRRVALYFKRLRLPDDIEIIIMDDGSDPPIRDTVNTYGCRNLFIYPTGDKRDWSIACARNLGIRIASGEYIFNTDIDHVLSKSAIQAAYNFTGDKMEFSREWGMLDNHGRLRQEASYLFKYGLDKRRYRKNGLRRYYHVGTHVIKRQIVFDIDGYPERTCNYGTHPTREDRLFYHRYRRYVEAGNAQPAVRVSPGPVVYCWPGTNDKCAHLFHGLPKKTGRGYANAVQTS